MNVFLNLLLILVVSLALCAIFLNVLNKTNKQRNKPVLTLGSIATDISDDKNSYHIASACVDGLNYAVNKYRNKDKDYIIMASCCYCEEILSRMDIDIDNSREELIHQLVVIGYDVFYQ